MKAKFPLAASAAAILLTCVPASLDAALPPVYRLNPPEEQSIGDTDPWVPDTHDPTGTLRDPDRSSVAAPETDGSSAVSNPRATWQIRLARILRILRIGGFVR